MKNKIERPELSYYGLLLTSYLQESHPEKINNKIFIKERAEMTGDAYESALLNGSNAIEAEEIAQDILFKNLHFSKHDTIVNIIWEEFPRYIKEENASTTAIILLPYLKHIFNKYILSDDFADTIYFKALRIELIGAISTYIENYGI